MSRSNIHRPAGIDDSVPSSDKTALLRYVTDEAVGFTVARCVGVESGIRLAFSLSKNLSLEDAR